MNNLLTAPATCFPNDCFCEAVNDTFPVQPINSFSSFSFVLVGVIIFIKEILKHNKPSKIYKTFAFITVFIGVASFLYHATLNFWAQFLDLISMFLLAAFIIAFNLDKSKKVTFWQTFILTSFTTSSLILFFPSVGRILFALLLSAGAILEIRNQFVRKRFSSRFLKALFFIGVASLIWMLDRYSVACNPYSIIQGHAIWHIICSLAAYYLYEYYVSS